MINPPEVKHNFEFVQFFFFFQLGFVYLIRPCPQRNRIGDPAKCTQSDGSLLVRDSMAIYFVRLIFTSQLSAFHDYLENIFRLLLSFRMRSLRKHFCIWKASISVKFVKLLPTTIFEICLLFILFWKYKLSIIALEKGGAALPVCRRSGGFLLEMAFWRIVCLFRHVSICQIQRIFQIFSVVWYNLFCNFSKWFVWKNCELMASESFCSTTRM